MILPSAALAAAVFAACGEFVARKSDGPFSGPARPKPELSNNVRPLMPCLACQFAAKSRSRVVPSSRCRASTTSLGEEMQFRTPTHAHFGEYSWDVIRCAERRCLDWDMTQVSRGTQSR